MNKRVKHLAAACGIDYTKEILGCYVRLDNRLRKFVPQNAVCSAQFLHRLRYFVFQSDMDLRAKGHNNSESTHRGRLKI